MTVSFTSSATDIFPSLLFPFEEAVVGLERTSYNLSEGNELVELCAVVVHPDIMCPINFPFNLSFSMAEGTGIYQVFLILMFLYILQIPECSSLMFVKEECVYNCTLVLRISHSKWRELKVLILESVLVPWQVYYNYV